MGTMLFFGEHIHTKNFNIYNIDLNLTYIFCE